jgi:hypothetical protein
VLKSIVDGGKFEPLNNAQLQDAFLRDQENEEGSYQRDEQFCQSSSQQSAWPNSRKNRV